MQSNWRGRRQSNAKPAASLSHRKDGKAHSAPYHQQKGITEVHVLRTDSAAATQEFIKLDVRPVEPFPGVNKPWRAVHERCGREVSPTLANARRNGGVCKHCGSVDAGVHRKARLAEHAATSLRTAGWEPLQPYPGANVPWHVRHVACGTELARSLNTIRRKPESCNTCYRSKNGHHQWTDHSAVAAFIARGLTPLEPYPGSSTKPWLARHDQCGRTVSPRLGNVAAGQGACNLCGLERTAASHRSDAAVVTAELRAAGYEPTAPFTSVDVRWPSVHSVCGKPATPTLSNLRRGQGGCVPCGLESLSLRFKMPEAQARKVMMSRGLTPVAPYPGSNAPWRCQHTCGKEVTPTLGNVRMGRGICRYCFSAFPYDGPSIVYLVADCEAVKIGCAARDSGRIAEHERRGWVDAWQVATQTGDDAYVLEQAIVTWWRDVLGAPQHYSADRLPQSGATETAAWDRSPPTAVLDALLAHAAALSIDVELHRATAVARDERPESLASTLGVRKRKQLERQQEAQLALFDEHPLT